MTSPMFELPEHQMIGLTADGNGPAEFSEGAFSHWGCWCGDPACWQWQSQALIVYRNFGSPDEPDPREQ